MLNAFHRFRRKHPGRAVAVFAAVAMIAPLAACGSDGDTNAESADDLTTITFAMDYLPGPAHNGLAYAIQEGLFEERGIEVDLLPYTDSPPDSLIAAGTADLGINWGANYAINNFAQGLPVTSVFVLYQHMPASLAVLSTSDINSPADLAGKRLGTFGDPFDPAIANTMIEADGGEGTVEPVVVGTAVYQALESGQVDAFLIYASDQFEFETLTELELRTWDPTEYGVPDYYGNLMLANNTFLEENSDLVRDFLEVFTEAYEFSLTNREVANEALEAQFPGETDPDLIDFVTQIQSDWLFVDPNGGVGTQELSTWQEAADFMAENGLLVDASGQSIEAELDLSEYITNEFLPES